MCGLAIALHVCFILLLTLEHQETWKTRETALSYRPVKVGLHLLSHLGFPELPGLAHGMLTVKKYYFSVIKYGLGS